MEAGDGKICRLYSKEFLRNGPMRRHFEDLQAVRRSPHQRTKLARITPGIAREKRREEYILIYYSSLFVVLEVFIVLESLSIKLVPPHIYLVLKPHSLLSLSL